MPDHVHIFVKCKSVQFHLSKIINHLKGFSSFTIRNKNSYLKRYKAFWSPSYFAESIGNISEKTVRKYIQNQKVNLKSTYKYSSMVSRQNNLKSFDIQLHGCQERKGHQSMSEKQVEEVQEKSYNEIGNSVRKKVQMCF